MSGIGVLTTMGDGGPRRLLVADRDHSGLDANPGTLPSTGWAMDAMHRLINFGYGGESAIVHLFAMAVAALVFGWLGARSFRYE